MKMLSTMKSLQGQALVDNISTEVVFTTLEVVQLFGFTCRIYNSSLFFKKDCFGMDHSFKVFIEFVTILLLFWFFVHKACRILAPQPRIKLTPPALEDEFLIIGPPRRPL